MDSLLPSRVIESVLLERSDLDLSGNAHGNAPIELEIVQNSRAQVNADLTTSITHQVNDALSSILLDGETNITLLTRSEPDAEKIKNVMRRMMSTARRASEHLRFLQQLIDSAGEGRVPLNSNDIHEEAPRNIK